MFHKTGRPRAPPEDHAADRAHEALGAAHRIQHTILYYYYTILYSILYCIITYYNVLLYNII